MKVHFIGIGGIGVSALARYFLANGHEVTGSDLEPSVITKSLEKQGAIINIGAHRPANVADNINLLIHSVAVNADNAELLKAKKLGIKIQTYPEAIGELTKKHWTIAISGAHGKGTTTAFLSLIFIAGGFDPTVIIGTNLREFNNANCRIGHSKYFVIEADEYQKTFLNYWPQAILLTNIDKEHLDCYRDIEDIKNTFKEFIGNLPKNGIVVANKDDKNVKSIFSNGFFPGKIIWYSLQQKEDADKLRNVLQIPGEHNVLNALGALALAREMGIPDEISFRSISGYKGAWRRFEILQEKPFVLVSDYAHHPSEIKATLNSAKEKYPDQRIWAIFQPHQYQRTYYLFNDFLTAFNRADKIIITEIYTVPGRETKEIKAKVSGEMLCQSLKKTGKEVKFIRDFKDIPKWLKPRLAKGDVAIVMGAGDIYKINDNLLE